MPVIAQFPLEKAILASHVLAGTISLLAGIGALTLGRKGGRLHRACGSCYFYAMAWIFISANLIFALYRFSAFFLFISMFSFYQAFSGFRVLRRKKPGSHTALDWSIAWAALAVIIGSLALSLGVARRGLALTDGLSLLFGALAVLAVRADILSFRRGLAFPPRWWLIHHIQAMVGSFIAAVTAFLVQNGARLTGIRGQQWLFWIAPTMLGTLYIVRETRRIRRETAGVASRPGTS
ncbi:MAG: hypothetical protein ABI036_07645 [Fibrobacteria bacterium]